MAGNEYFDNIDGEINLNLVCETDWLSISPDNVPFNLGVTPGFCTLSEEVSQNSYTSCN